MGQLCGFPSLSLQGAQAAALAGGSPRGQGTEWVLRQQGKGPNSSAATSTLPGRGCCLRTCLWKSATKWVQIKSPSELRTLAPGTLLVSPPPELGPSLQSPGVQGKASLVFDLMPAGPSVAAQMFFFTYAHTRICPLEYFSPSLYKCI